AERRALGRATCERRERRRARRGRRRRPALGTARAPRRIDAMSMDTALLIGPLLIVAFGGLAMMLVDAFTKTRAELAILSTVILAAAAAMALGLWFTAPPVEAHGLIGRYLAYDKLAHFLDIVICGGAALSALLAGGY